MQNVEFASSGWHIVAAFVTWVLGALASLCFAGSFGVRRNMSFSLYAWHTLFCFLYLAYISNFGGDSISYYLRSFESDLTFSFGSGFVRYFTSFFSVYLNFSILNVFLVFNIIGFVGLLAFYGALRSASESAKAPVRRLAVFLVFLPSVSFWSVALGKDAIAMLSIGLALWASIYIKRRFLLLVLAVTLMFLVRPHVAAIFLASMTLFFTFSKSASYRARLFAGFLTVISAFVIVPFALDYAGLSNPADVDAVVSYVEDKQENYQNTGSGVDLSVMPMPVQLFTYLFRPLPIEATNIFSLFVSIENTLIMMVIFSSLILYFKKKSFLPENYLFLISFSFLSWVILAVVTPNLGIAVRQKWMFLPALLYVSVYVLASFRACPDAQDAQVDRFV